MKAILRKPLLIVHILTSVGLLGSVASFLVLAVIGMLSIEPETLRTTYQAMSLLTFYVVLPMAVTSLVIGIIQSLCTPWGLIRHYWVIAKLTISVLTVLIILAQLPTIEMLAVHAKLQIISAADMGPQMRVIVHALGGFVVLLVATILSVYKPRGISAYGMRRQLPKNQNDKKTTRFMDFEI